MQVNLEVVWQFIRKHVALPWKTVVMHVFLVFHILARICTIENIRIKDRTCDISIHKGVL